MRTAGVRTAVASVFCTNSREANSPLCASVAAGLFVVLSACGNHGQSAAGAQPLQGTAPQAQAVAAIHPVRTSWDRTLRLSGTLEALNSVQLGARVEGAITNVRYDLGDRVAQGAVLAHITAEDYRARITQADADLAQARADLARVEALSHHEYAAVQALEQARTRVAMSEAARALAARQMRDTAIRAPFAGAISARYVAPGAYVKTGTPLFDLVEVDSLRLVVQVPERFASTIGMGAQIQVAPDGSNADPIVATVNRVSPLINATTRTYRVEAVVDARGGTLRPGMFVTGNVHLGRTDNAARVPRAAVFTVLGHDRIALVRNGVATPTDVEILGESGDDAILEGLATTELVVVRGASSLAPGTPVRTTESPAGTRNPG